ncbi:Uncharacterised protein [Vibrio cholerae]|nr:Uncharacterised protein [Vibrio cholerae]
MLLAPTELASDTRSGAKNVACINCFRNTLNRRFVGNGRWNVWR